MNIIEATYISFLPWLPNHFSSLLCKESFLSLHTCKKKKYICFMEVVKQEKISFCIISFSPLTKYNRGGSIVTIKTDFMLSFKNVKYHTLCKESTNSHMILYSYRQMHRQTFLQVLCCGTSLQKFSCIFKYKASVISTMEFSYLGKYTKQMVLHNVLVLIGKALCV